MLFLRSQMLLLHASIIYNQSSTHPDHHDVVVLFGFYHVEPINDNSPYKKLFLVHFVIVSVPSARLQKFTMLFIVLHCSSLFFIALHHSSLLFIILHCSSSFFIALHCSSLLFITLHCS